MRIHLCLCQEIRVLCNSCTEHLTVEMLKFEMLHFNVDKSPIRQAVYYHAAIHCRTRQELSYHRAKRIWLSRVIVIEILIFSGWLGWRVGRDAASFSTWISWYCASMSNRLGDVRNGSLTVRATVLVLAVDSFHWALTTTLADHIPAVAFIGTTNWLWTYYLQCRLA